ncbi:MAG: hypothetical protein A3G18_08930 [Rhodospirillales bacterium RIFCSPLOWO2_12_FULL_58_28]|nr:MAG: hypothetical protein A3H92_01525 [Rhodospirillales bacterium RIFCSPLOWO2_02_FULL_58_16]OHC78429.1 MAG: hypothetical protein A3G18_08930 [Rhodospirillales bacterium RIFCSPLOWO2_12_FULL_58_28]
MKTTQNLAVLFADITGSTGLYEKEGNKRAFALVSECLHTLVSKAKPMGGTHIKTIGDEIMMTFPNADGAFQAAKAMQEALIGAPLSIKVGFHYGPVIPEAGDVYGDVVNVASRVAKVAARDEVITTGDAVEKLSPANRGNVRHLDTMTVKGRAGMIDLYQVIWQTDELTIMAGETDTVKPETGPVMVITCDGKEYHVNRQSGRFSIGRGDQNNLVIDDSLVSRRHAGIEYRRGRFILTDQSSNGTYILKGDVSSLVKRESTELSDSGLIGLGKKPKRDSGKAIKYDCLNC